MCVKYRIARVYLNEIGFAIAYGALFATRETKYARLRGHISCFGRRPSGTETIDSVLRINSVGNHSSRPSAQVTSSLTLSSLPFSWQLSSLSFSLSFSSLLSSLSFSLSFSSLLSSLPFSSLFSLFSSLLLSS